MKLDKISYEAITYALEAGFQRWSPYPNASHFAFDGCLWEWCGDNLPRGFFRHWESRVFVEPSPGHEPWLYKVSGDLVCTRLKEKFSKEESAEDGKYIKDCEFRHVYVTIDGYKKGGRSLREPFNERVSVEPIAFFGRVGKRSINFFPSCRQEVSAVRDWVWKFDNSKYPICLAAQVKRHEKAE